MTKQAKIPLIALAVLVILYLINTRMQDKYTAKDTDLFSNGREHITRIFIQKNDEELDLVKVDTLWTITNNDSLNVKKNIVNNFRVIFRSFYVSESEPETQFWALSIFFYFLY